MNDIASETTSTGRTYGTWARDVRGETMTLSIEVTGRTEAVHGFFVAELRGEFGQRIAVWRGRVGDERWLNLWDVWVSLMGFGAYSIEGSPSRRQESNY